MKTKKNVLKTLKSFVKKTEKKKQKKKQIINFNKQLNTYLCLLMINNSLLRGIFHFGHFGGELEAGEGLGGEVGIRGGGTEEVGVTVATQ